MATPDELAHAARTLAGLFHELGELKFAPTRTPNVRVQKPTFRSISPTPDQDWAFNLEHELMRDTTDERIPGGLANITKDALDYTHARRHRTRDYDPAGYRDHDVTPGVLCAYIARHAAEISNDFPAAQELLELLVEQRTYLSGKLAERYGRQALKPMPSDTITTGYGTAADIAPFVSSLVGKSISREQIRYWGRSGRITTYTTPSGTTHYQVSQVVEQAHVYQDKRISQ